MALHQVLVGYIITCLEPLLGLTVNAVSSYGVVVTIAEIFFIGLGLTVTEVNINKQDLKNIKNIKRCRDGMPKSMQTR